MKFENAAIVMTDTDTGKPYARPLSAWELNLVLSQLQALDGGALKAREIAPFVMRTPGIRQADAEHIAQKQAGLHHVARNGVQAFVDMAKADTAPPPITDQLIGKRVSLKVGRVTHGTGKIPGGVQQIAKQQPAKACECITDFRGQCVDCGQPLPKTTPVDRAVAKAALLYRQKHCPHETVLAGVCIVCDKRVKS